MVIFIVILILAGILDTAIGNYFIPSATGVIKVTITELDSSKSSYYIVYKWTRFLFIPIKMYADYPARLMDREILNFTFFKHEASKFRKKENAIQIAKKFANKENYIYDAHYEYKKYWSSKKKSKNKESNIKEIMKMMEKLNDSSLSESEQIAIEEKLQSL